MSFAKTYPISANYRNANFRATRTTLCFNNPNYRNWLLAIVEDWSRSHPIDGIMWGSERQGAFSNALSASHGRSDPNRVTCFCQFCQEKRSREA
jgi:hypothetical protein